MGKTLDKVKKVLPRKPGFVATTQDVIDEKYNKGVDTTRNIPITVGIAKLMNSMMARDEKELLEDRDSTLRNLRKLVVNGALIITPFFIGLPLKMADSAIQQNVDRQNAEEYNNTFDKEILWVDKQIVTEQKAGRDVSKLRAYKKSLVDSKAKMNSYIAKMDAVDKDKDVAAKEAAFQTRLLNPSTPMEAFIACDRLDYNSDHEFDMACIEAFRQLIISTNMRLLAEASKMEELDKKVSANDKPITEPGKKDVDFDVEKEGKDAKKQSEKMLHLKECFLIRADNLLGSMCKCGHIIHRYVDKEYNYRRSRIALLNGDADRAIVARFIADDSKEVLKMRKQVEKMVNTIAKSFNDDVKKIELVNYDDSTDVALVVKEDITHTAQDAVRAVVHKGRDVANAVGDPNEKVDRVIEPVDNLVNKIIHDWKKFWDTDKRDQIIHGARFNLRRMIIKGLTLGAIASYFNPIVAAIAFCGKILHDRAVDEKYRKTIYTDMQEELTIVKEKIEDAKNKGDNEAKYKLMRIQHQLERQMANVRYNVREPGK
jgi:hypothetical protein